MTPLRDILSDSSGNFGIVGGLKVEHCDNVAVLTLCRPEHHNALTLAMWRQLKDACSTLADDESLSVLVIRGAGGKAFAAGADISEFAEYRCDPASASRYDAAISDALEAVIALPIPVIAMVDGLAVGGGCELAAACDIRIASERSKLGIPIGRLGVILGLPETRAVVRHTGPHNLKYLLFTGALLSSHEAMQRGLVDEVVNDSELVNRVVAVSDVVSRHSQTTMRAAKQITDMASRPMTNADRDTLNRLHRQAYGGPDLREGVAAFLAKRQPRFSGRQP